MPEPKPKLGLLRRIFGDPISQSTEQEWPELRKSWAGREVEMPDESNATTGVRPMNFLERYYFGPQTQAATYPWGTIALNRENIDKNKVNLDSLLVHELTHIGQGKKEGIWGAYTKGGSKDMPDYEQEAYDAENNRYKKVRTTDINLPTPIRR